MPLGEVSPRSAMLTLEVAGTVCLGGIQDVRRVFLWFGRILTLAGPRPFLLVLMSRCSRRACFLYGSAFIPYYLLSPLIAPLFIAARGDFGCFMCFYGFSWFFFFFSYLLLFVSRFLLGWSTCMHLR